MRCFLENRHFWKHSPLHSFPVRAFLFVYQRLNCAVCIMGLIAQDVAIKRIYLESPFCSIKQKHIWLSQLLELWYVEHWTTQQEDLWRISIQQIFCWCTIPGPPTKDLQLHSIPFLLIIFLWYFSYYTSCSNIFIHEFTSIRRPRGTIHSRSTFHERNMESRKTFSSFR